MPILEENKDLYISLHDRVNHGDSQKSTFTWRTIMMMEAGYDKDKVINELITIGNELFSKFTAVIAALPPHNSELLKKL